MPPASRAARVAWWRPTLHGSRRPRAPRPGRPLGRRRYGRGPPRHRPAHSEPERTPRDPRFDTHREHARSGLRRALRARATDVDPDERPRLRAGVAISPESPHPTSPVGCSPVGAGEENGSAGTPRFRCLSEPCRRRVLPHFDCRGQGVRREPVKDASTNRPITLKREFRAAPLWTHTVVGRQLPVPDLVRHCARHQRPQRRGEARCRHSSAPRVVPAAPSAGSWFPATTAPIVKVQAPTACGHG